MRGGACSTIRFSKMIFFHFPLVHRQVYTDKYMQSGLQGEEHLIYLPYLSVHLTLYRMSTISSSVVARLSKVLPSLDSISVAQLTAKPPLASYSLPRTSKGNLPIYRTIRSQAVYTEIKRVQGNVVSFRNDLQTLLPHIPKEKYSCRTINGCLRIKGDFKDEILELLQKKF
ncbi:uncharacterized protein C5L36_0A00860 [Pichia kudriavzevii]|uniref:Large ribosomal subunit protein mL49 n=2 Tax=Pichia kudriavzevii TaxID=4909 RepID=A0A2U9QWV1_PICKU|nr:uncharacterized protein C5L36_0A00860 [Pichia kudriavzevii]AWU73478.1 hypothetical protein C5L36_0A00860 [Pichia kudriavzevii]